MEPEPKRRRPVGLYVIVVLQLVLAVLMALVLLGLEEGLPILRLLVKNPIFYTKTTAWLLVASLLLAVLGLLLQKRWGWLITMILTGSGLAYSIWSYFQGAPLYLPMVVYVIMVLYLNQREVQQPFRKRASPEPAP